MPPADLFCSERSRCWSCLSFCAFPKWLVSCLRFAPSWLAFGIVGVALPEVEGSLVVILKRVFKIVIFVFLRFDSTPVAGELSFVTERVHHDTALDINLLVV